MIYARNLCVDVCLDGSFESFGIGTDDLGDLVTTLEEKEGGHGANTEFLCDIGDLVDVELVEARIGVCTGEPVGIVRGNCRMQTYDYSLDNLGCNNLARTAPGSEAVKNHEARAVVQSFIKCCLAGMPLAVTRRCNDFVHWKQNNVLRY